jgi:HEAT repeat protein
MKRRALKALAKLRPLPKDAVPAVAKLLDDEACRAEAFAAVIEFGPAASDYLPQLVNVKRAVPHWNSRYEEHQVSPSRKECVKLIAEWMQDPLPTKRANAELLWKLVGQQDATAVTALFKSGSPRDRNLAMDKLCELGPAGVPPFLELLKSDDPSERRTAIRALGIIGPAAKASVPVLVTTLKDKQSQDRCLAVIALGQIGADSAPAVAALKGALTESDGGIRICAIEALGRLGPPAAPATTGLIECLRDRSPSIRSAAARALGQIGPAAKAALPELEKLTHDPEDYVRQAASEAAALIVATSQPRPKK